MQSDATFSLQRFYLMKVLIVDARNLGVAQFITDADVTTAASKHKQAYKCDRGGRIEKLLLPFT
jgi:hypothetical protein